MDAQIIVDALIENDDFDPKDYVSKQVDKAPFGTLWVDHKFTQQVPPGFQRRSGKGYDQQWWIIYKDWKFVVSTYDNGESIWSAYYSNPRFSWSNRYRKTDPERPPQGREWGGGAEPVRLPPGYGLDKYFQRLKRMADKYPGADVFRSGRVPEMPAELGKERYHDAY